MKVGVVALIGRPNVGKSTFVNQILQMSLSIVASTPQTTRNIIKAVYNDQDSQIVFLDTPGIHRARSKFGSKLNELSLQVLKEDIDLLIFLTSADEPLYESDLVILDKIEKIKNKIAILTKTDLIKEHEKTELKVKKLKTFGFKEVLGVSLLNNYGLTKILPDIKKFCKEGPRLFTDKEAITDLPTSFFVKEIIREKAMKNVYDEVVHSIYVEITSFQETMVDIKIDAIIFVERDSQKRILIGKGASMIKQIGIEARNAIQDLTGVKTHLTLVVKVAKNWTKNEKHIKKLGY